MNNDVIISVEGLGKRYRITHQAEGRRYVALRDVLAEKAKGFFKMLKLKESKAEKLKTGNLKSGNSDVSVSECQRVSISSSEDFWALKDVSFEVRRGEVVGIIGRNGAGKSTLLKILSRITEPTEGRVTLRGRVASLLEVGTGFHPELTGRENVFLNGAILGMHRAEIKRKFDEIVAFAEVDKFLDTPVKRYSSGMYVRLAFAVAAHLEPEILVVDEVLAVGDTEFQKKCLGKMKDDSGKEGRTVLFVSHNMAAVNNLCSRALMLDGGRVIHDGETAQVVDHYLNSGMEKSGEITWPNPEEAPGNDRVRLKAVRIISESKVTADVMLDQDCHIEIDYVNHADNLPLGASIHLLDKMGVEVLASANFHSANLIRDNWFGKGFPKGVFRTVCTIPANFLNENHYSIRVAIVSNNSHLELLTGEIIGFNTHDTGEMRKEYTGHWLGVVRPKLAWQTELLG
jgi:lipopolysaccharide transport system ATP-binding protein